MEKKQFIQDQVYFGTNLQEKKSSLKRRNCTLVSTSKG